MTPKWRFEIQFTIYAQYSKTVFQQHERATTTTARIASSKTTKRTILREALPLTGNTTPRAEDRSETSFATGRRRMGCSTCSGARRQQAPLGRSDPTPRRRHGDGPPPAGVRSVPRGRPQPARFPAGASAVPAGRRRPPRGSGAAPPRGGGCGEAAPHTPHAAAAAASAVRPASPGCGGGWRFRSEPCPGGSMWPVRAGGVRRGKRGEGGGDGGAAAPLSFLQPGAPRSAARMEAARPGAVRQSAVASGEQRTPARRAPCRVRGPAAAGRGAASPPPPPGLPPSPTRSPYPPSRPAAAAALTEERRGGAGAPGRRGRLERPPLVPASPPRSLCARVRALRSRVT